MGKYTGNNYEPITGQIWSDKTRVIQQKAFWEREKYNKIELKGRQEHSEAKETEFCPIVLWSVRTEWMLQITCVEVEPLNIMHINKIADREEEY